MKVGSGASLSSPRAGNSSELTMMVAPPKMEITPASPSPSSRAGNGGEGSSGAQLPEITKAEPLIITDAPQSQEMDRSQSVLEQVARHLGATVLIGVPVLGAEAAGMACLTSHGKTLLPLKTVLGGTAAGIVGSLILDSQCTTHCDPDKRHIGNIGDIMLCATTTAACAPPAFAAGMIAGGLFGLGAVAGVRGGMSGGRGAGATVVITAIAGGVLGCGAGAPLAGVLVADVKNDILGTRPSIFSGLLGMEETDEIDGNQKPKSATSLFSKEGAKTFFGKLSEKFSESSKKSRKKDDQASARKSAGKNSETVREPLLGNERDADSDMPSTSHAEERNTSTNENGVEEVTVMGLAGQLSRQISNRLLGNEQDSASETSSTSHPEEPNTFSNENKDKTTVQLTDMVEGSAGSF